MSKPIRMSDQQRQVLTYAVAVHAGRVRGISEGSVVCAEQIELLSGLSRNAVSNALKVLKRRGFINWVRGEGERRADDRWYRVMLVPTDLGVAVIERGAEAAQAAAREARIKRFERVLLQRRLAWNKDRSLSIDRALAEAVVSALEEGI